jgi:hypothetical protein
MVLCSTSINVGEFRRIGAFKCGERHAPNYAVGGDAYYDFMRLLEDSGPDVARSVCAKVVEGVEHSKEIFSIAIV